MMNEISTFRGTRFCDGFVPKDKNANRKKKYIPHGRNNPGEAESYSFREVIIGYKVGGIEFLLPETETIRGVVKNGNLKWDFEGLDMWIAKKFKKLNIESEPIYHIMESGRSVREEREAILYGHS